MSKDYVSLHNHTVWSIMDSLIWPEKLFAKAKEYGQSAIAVTDHATLAAAWDSLKYSKQYGVKLIIGCEFFFTDDLSNESEKLRHIILLAKNQEGYKNLLLAHKLANDNFILLSKKVVPRIDWNILKKCSKGLICITGCGNGILSKLINTRQPDKAFEQAQRLKDIFGDNLAFEIQPHAMKRNAGYYNSHEDQTFVNNKLIEFADKLNIKIVATTNAHYLTKDQWEAHDTEIAIGHSMPVKSVARLRYPVNEFYIKTRDEVESFFRRTYGNRAAEFCDNSLIISNMCEPPEWIAPQFSNPSGKELPEFRVMDQPDYTEYCMWLLKQNNKIQELSEDKSYLRYLCDKALVDRIPQDKWQEYCARLEEEFEVLEFHNFSSYFLIVSDFVSCYRKNNIVYSPGRGSVGGSLIAYLIDIHDADPIKYELIFSRFLNKFKTSFPDCDNDISSSGRADIQAYLIKKYGEENVCHVSNINTVTPKLFARDIARAFEFGGNQKAAVAIGTFIADSIPDDVKTIKSALKDAPLFAEYAIKYPQLKKFAEVFDGLPKAWSTHAGGIIIGKRPLVDIVPLRKDKDGNIAIESEKNRAEENGLVKIDILGLSTLDIIESTIKLIKQAGKEFDINELRNYDGNDLKSYELMTSGQICGVFQLGDSPGTTSYTMKYKPNNIEDLAYITTLVRPAQSNIRASFLETRFSAKKIPLLHPNLSKSLNNTYGYAIFEECLMYIGQDIAGWDLHECDNLRKMTKDKGKHPEKVAQWRDNFIRDAKINKGIDKEIASEIWSSLIEGFGGYGFNKSHAVLYSMLTFQTAYLKSHYPLEFLAANLMFEVQSAALSAKENITTIKNEIRSRNIKILPPNINNSDIAYKIIDENTLMTGLDAIKFLGKNALPEILKKRPFISFEDFVYRIDGRKLDCRGIQALAAVGCFDEFGFTRKQIFLYGGDFKKKVQLWVKKGLPIKDFKYPWSEEVGEWTVSEKYAMEFKYIGEGLCCKPSEAYSGFFNNRALDFSTMEEKYPDTGNDGEKFYISVEQGIVEGIVKRFFEFKVKKEGSRIFGESMAKIELEDPYGNKIAMTLFPSKLKHFKYRLKELSGNKIKLEPGIGIYCSCQVNRYESSLSLIFEDLKQCAPIPQEPKDQERKSIKMKMPIIRKNKRARKVEVNDFIDQIEDEMTEAGLDEFEEDSDKLE